MGLTTEHFLQYAILFGALKNEGDFHDDYIVDVLISCNRKTVLLSSQPRKPNKRKQGSHYDFTARDENPMSTSYALDCIEVKRNLCDPTENNYIIFQLQDPTAL